MQFEHVDPDNPIETVIRVAGLRGEVVLAHITDTHISEADGREPAAVTETARLEPMYAKHVPDGLSTGQMFERLMARAREIRADCTVLTGDIVNYPSLAGIERVVRAVAGREYLFTLGNHDWHFLYHPWNDATRQAHYPRFHGLTGGNPAFGVRVMRGVRLVALDNSMYQVSPAQLEFLRAQLAFGDPCFLFIHIPIYIPSLVPKVMQVWQAPIMMGAEGEWTGETRAKWMVGDVEESTRDCLALLRGAENLGGIFCGHVHFAHADRVGAGCVQYVTRAGMEGGFRKVRILGMGKSSADCVVLVSV